MCGDRQHEHPSQQLEDARDELVTRRTVFGLSAGGALAQRFLHGAWLTPLEDGYSRAIPLRFLPTFPPKAIPAEGASAGMAGRAGLPALAAEGLDQRGRAAEPVLAGGWQFRYPGDVAEAAGTDDPGDRTARNRRRIGCLSQKASLAPAARPATGNCAPHPVDWLHAGLRRWPSQRVWFGARRSRCVTSSGTFRAGGGSGTSVVRDRVQGLPSLIAETRQPLQTSQAFVLPGLGRPTRGSLAAAFPDRNPLSWIWQRWEIEVAHREMKSGLGIGEKQCGIDAPPCSPSSGPLGPTPSCSLPMTAFMPGPPCPGPSAAGRQTWSFNTLWRTTALHSGQPEFRVCWTPSPAVLVERAGCYGRERCWLAPSKRETHSCVSALDLSLFLCLESDRSGAFIEITGVQKLFC